MHPVQRALSAVAVTVVAVPVLGTGAASAEPAPSPPVERPQARGVLDPILGPILGPILEPLKLLLAPVLEGLGRVGSLLTVSQPQWNLPLDLVRTDIEWLCDGSLIPGTEGLWQYTPTELQQGCEITARVVGRVLGLVPLEHITNAIPIAEAPKTPTATKAPVLAGDPKVGKQLTVTAPAWEGEDDVTTTYQWLRAGGPIAGATTTSYTVAPEDVGKAISVRATGTRQGAPATGTSVSNALTAALGDAPTAPAVAVTGAPRVGQQLTAQPPQWSGTGAITTTYQWLRDGQPVAGATTATYTVAAADADRTLSVRATGTRVGYHPGTSTSAPLPVAPGEALTATVRPSIAGTARVGATLEARPGTWSPAAPGTEHAYQWLRDGAPIAGATTDRYVVRAEDAGHALAVRVTATATGHAPGSATSDQVDVVRTASTTTLTLVKKAVPKGRRGKVRIEVAAPGTTATGTVTVRIGDRVVASVRLKPAHAGSRTVRLPRLGPGKHRLTATYAGEGAVAGSSSKSVTLKVRKAKKRR